MISKICEELVEQFDNFSNTSSIAKLANPVGPCTTSTLVKNFLFNLKFSVIKN